MASGLAAQNIRHQRMRIMFKQRHNYENVLWQQPLASCQSPISTPYYGYDRNIYHDEVSDEGCCKQAVCIHF